MVISKDKLEIVRKDVISYTLEYWGPNDWAKDTLCLVYDTDLFGGVREFAVVFDRNYNILLIGWSIGEAYWEPNKAPREDVLQISYIRDLDDDYYIFFNEHCHVLNNGMNFDKLDNMNGEINARDLNGHWWSITPRGPEEPID